MPAPIAMFVYNRKDHAQETIEALAQNDLAKDSDVFIHSDGPSKPEHQAGVEGVRAYLDTLEAKGYFKSVTLIKAPQNIGLSKSIITGVSNIMKRYGQAIIIEDDLVSSRDVLRFLNDGLDFYKDKEDIWAVGAYNIPIDIPDDYGYDVYKAYRTNSWGWASWGDRWKKIDWKMKDYASFLKSRQRQRYFMRGGNDLLEMLSLQMQGKLQSWDSVWCYHQAKFKSFTIYPTVSRIKNIGFDGSGYHGNVNESFDIPFSQEPKPYTLTYPEVDPIIQKRFLKHFYKYPTWMRRLKRRVKRVIGMVKR